MQHEPVLDRRGRPVMVVGPDGKLHAHYRFDARNAIDSLKLLGKELGMFGRSRETKSWSR
jgi:hypothetical protein